MNVYSIFLMTTYSHCVDSDDRIYSTVSFARYS